MKNKKKLIIICTGAAVLLAATGLTLAYLGTQSSKDNKITVGYGDVSITEQWSEPEQQSMQNTTQKEVKVTNTGSVPCFVRVYAEFSDSRVADKAKVTNFTDYYLWAAFKEELAKSTNTISPDWKFVANDDTKIGGYFYYTKKLPAGESTSSLIKAVKTDYRDGAADSNIDKIQSFDIIVYSEIVQTTELDGTEYNDSDWLAAWKSFLRVTP